MRQIVTAFKDESFDGFTRAVESAFVLHQAYPRHREALAGKTGPRPKYVAPELFPPLKERFTANLQDGAADKVRRSCIHCHMIQEAQRTVARTAGTLRGSPRPAREKST